MKTMSFAKRYNHLTTKKPWFFYTFLLAGVALFLYLTLTTHLDTADGKQTLLYIIFVKAGGGI